MRQEDKKHSNAQIADNFKISLYGNNSVKIKWCNPEKWVNNFLDLCKII